MKPSELKTGMIVKLHDNGYCMVLRDCFAIPDSGKDVLWRQGGFWMPLDTYTEDMKCIPSRGIFIDDDAHVTESDIEIARGFDIVAVIAAKSPAFISHKEWFGNRILWTEEDGDMNEPFSWHRITKENRKAGGTK